MESAVKRKAKQGKVWVDIEAAASMAELLTQNDKNVELAVIIEMTLKQAEKLNELEISEDETLTNVKLEVKELKLTAVQLSKSGAQLKTRTEDLITAYNSFDRFVEENVSNCNVPEKCFTEFCNLLEELRLKTQEFSNEYVTFAGQLTTIHNQATSVTDLLNSKNKELSKKASLHKHFGIAGTVIESGAGLVAAGVGIGCLIALGFFTGGAACLVAGVVGIVAGAGAIGGAVATHVCSSKGVSKLRELAEGVLTNANKLDIIAKGLKSAADKAGNFNMDKEAAEAFFKEAMDFFQAEENRKRETDRVLEERLAKRDAEKDAEMARIVAENKELQAKIQALGCHK